MLLNILILVKSSLDYLQDAVASRIGAENKDVEVVGAAWPMAATGTVPSKTLKKGIGSNVSLRIANSIADYVGSTEESTQRTFYEQSGITLMFEKRAKVDSGFSPIAD